MKIENTDLNIIERELNINNEIIRVKTYIPIQEKIEIVEKLKNELFPDLIINQPKFDALLNILIILAYTDIEIEDKSIENLLKVYDYLEYNGYITMILEKIPKIEYSALIGYVNDTIKDFNIYKVSIAGTVERLANSVPAIMENIDVLKKELKESDLEMAKTLYERLEH